MSIGPIDADGPANPRLVPKYRVQMSMDRIAG
jgi:hypothetical protein